MPSFGENLRREREMRGVTLEEISAATKISLRFLKALEGEEFSALPSGIFTRSFIRAYAKHLGLDEEPILAEYQLAARPEVEIDLHRMTITKPVPERGTYRTALLALLVAVAMLGGSYLLYRYTRPASEIQGRVINPGGVSDTSASPAPQSHEATSPPAGPPAPTATKVSSARGAASATQPAREATTASSSQTNPTAPKTSKAQADLILQVAATEQAWVAVTADGRTTFQRILNPRELKTLKAKESFDVVTGNAQGIILTLNGETLNPLGGHNVYKKIHLTRDDLKNPAP
jgi:cytoskeleton protein RodZ